MTGGGLKDQNVTPDGKLKIEGVQITACDRA